MMWLPQTRNLSLDASRYKTLLKSYVFDRHEETFDICLCKLPQGSSTQVSKRIVDIDLDNRESVDSNEVKLQFSVDLIPPENCFSMSIM